MALAKHAKLAKVRVRSLSRGDAEIGREEDLLPSYLRVSAPLREQLFLCELGVLGESLLLLQCTGWSSTISTR